MGERGCCPSTSRGSVCWMHRCMRRASARDWRCNRYRYRPFPHRTPIAVGDVALADGARRPSRHRRTAQHGKLRDSASRARYISALRRRRRRFDRACAAAARRGHASRPRRARWGPAVRELGERRARSGPALRVRRWPNVRSNSASRPNAWASAAWAAGRTPEGTIAVGTYQAIADVAHGRQLFGFTPRSARSEERRGSGRPAAFRRPRRARIDAMAATAQPGVPGTTWWAETMHALFGPRLGAFGPLQLDRRPETRPHHERPTGRPLREGRRHRHRDRIVGHRLSPQRASPGRLRRGPGLRRALEIPRGEPQSAAAGGVPPGISRLPRTAAPARSRSARSSARSTA